MIPFLLGFADFDLCRIVCSVDFAAGVDRDGNRAPDRSEAAVLQRKRPILFHQCLCLLKYRRGQYSAHAPDQSADRFFHSIEVDVDVLRKISISAGYPDFRQA